MSGPPAILETVLYASDLDAAEAFYAGLFGLVPVRRLAGRFVFLRAAGGMLLIFDPVHSGAQNPANPIPRHGAMGPGHVCFAATADEMPGWRARLAAHDVSIEAEHVWPGGARSIYLRDPAGNSVELGEPRMWGPGGGPEPDGQAPADPVNPLP